MMSAQFLRFLATGGFAVVANLGSRYLLNQVISFEFAVVVAYLIGMSSAYALARLFVFRMSGRSVVTELRRFAIVNVFALMMVWIISVSLAFYLFPALQFTWHSNDIAHFVGVIAPAVTSYIGHQYYTFRPADFPRSRVSP
jgi:putative flippase GtrA